MEELMTTLEPIPTDPLYTAGSIGVVAVLLLLAGVVVFIVAAGRREEMPDTVADGFEESLMSEQRSRSTRLLALGLCGVGIIVGLFAAFSVTGPEGVVARNVVAAKSAAESGDLKGAEDALAVACAEVQCHDDEADVIVKPELQEQVATAHVQAIRLRADRIAESGDIEGGLEMMKRAYELEPGKSVLDGLNGLYKMRAKRLEAAGDLVKAAQAFEEAEAFEDATRLHAKIDRHDDLCRLYPKILKFLEAGAACLKAGNTALGGYYYLQAGEPMLAADAYLKAESYKQGINILLEAGKLRRAAESYTDWAKKSDEKAADWYLAAAGLYEDLGELEMSIERKRQAADAYAQLAQKTESSTQRIAAWQLYTDLEDEAAATEQMELAIAKAAEFKSVGGLVELVRLGGEIERGISMVRGWADDALDRGEAHEAAQYLSLLLSKIMGDDAEPLSEEEMQRMQAVMPKLLETNARIAQKVAEYPTIKVAAYAITTKFPDSGLELHKHTTLRGTVTNPHEVPIEAIKLRVILFEPRPDTDEIQIDGWRRIMAERDISEEEARKEWDKQTSAREEELYSAPVGFKRDIELGRIEPGESIDVNEILDSNVSYQYIDYYFVGMKRGE